MFYKQYIVADFNTKMNKSTLKQKRDTSTIEPNIKCTTNNKTLNFKNLCKEITRKQIDVITVGKFVVNNFIIVKLNKKLLKKSYVFKLNMF